MKLTDKFFFFKNWRTASKVSFSLLGGLDFVCAEGAVLLELAAMLHLAVRD